MSSKILLYSCATPNGQKVSIALEEMGLEYTANTINILNGDQFKPEYIKINPNSKIPAIVDLNGPGGEPISIMESGAILFYLAQKTGKFFPSDIRLQSETLQWLFFQVGGVGPIFGQFGHFYKYGKSNCDHPYPVERYKNEVIRLLNVLERRLEARKYLINDEYTIADMATYPWVESLTVSLEAEKLLGIDNLTHVKRWCELIRSRPLTEKAMNVCPI